MRPRILFVATTSSPFTGGEQGMLVAPFIAHEWQVDFVTCLHPEPKISAETTGREGLRRPRRVNWWQAAQRLRNQLRQTDYSLVHSWDQQATDLLSWLRPILSERARRWKWVAQGNPATQMTWTKPLPFGVRRRPDWWTSSWPKKKETARADALSKIPLAVPRQSSPRGDFRSAMGFADNLKVIGAVCPLEASSGVKHLIWILDQIKCVRSDLRLVVWGSGSMASSLERYARHVGVDDWMRWLIPDSRTRDAIAELDVYWHAPRTTGYPPALVAALAHGVPSIATETDATRKLLPEWEGLLVTAVWGARDEFARQTHQWLLAADRPQTPAQASAWIANHDPAVSANRLIELYRRLIA